MIVCVIYEQLELSRPINVVSSEPPNHTAVGAQFPECQTHQLE